MKKYHESHEMIYLQHRENHRVFGPSIEERPEEAASRNVFGHWEIDTLIGARDKDDPVLLTSVE